MNNRCPGSGSLRMVAQVVAHFKFEKVSCLVAQSAIKSLFLLLNVWLEVGLTNCCTQGALFVSISPLGAC